MHFDDAETTSKLIRRCQTSQYSLTTIGIYDSMFAVSSVSKSIHIINTDYVPEQYEPTDYCNGDALCFLWGTNKIFKCCEEFNYVSVNLVLTGNARHSDVSGISNKEMTQTSVSVVWSHPTRLLSHYRRHWGWAAEKMAAYLPHSEASVFHSCICSLFCPTCCNYHTNEVANELTQVLN